MEEELKEAFCITWGPVGAEGQDHWELISSLENMIIQGNDGIAIRFSGFLLVAETWKIKREWEKAWEQKWPEGEMTKTSWETQRMVIQECCFTASLCETPVFSYEGGWEQSQFCAISLLHAVLNNVKQFWAFHFSCRLRILNRECQACRKVTVITNPKAACDLSCHF